MIEELFMRRKDTTTFADALEEADRREDIYIVGTSSLPSFPIHKPHHHFPATVWQATGRFFNAGANVGKRSPGETYRETRSVRRKELARITTITDVARLVRLSLSFHHSRMAG
jgi:hypothetical protein